MTPTRRKAGRPKLTDDQRRTRVLHVRATRYELDMLHRIAYHQGQRASKLIRDEVRRIIAASSSLIT